MPCNARMDSFIRNMSRFIGETVTIYTTSGGESGRGFTGVLIGISRDPFVRLLTEIGSAPGCALGSCCDVDDNFGDEDFEDEDFEESTGGNRRRFDCGRRTAGAVVDIPVDRIAAFVHNAL